MQYEGYDFDKMIRKGSRNMAELLENIDDDCVFIIARKKK
jgi:hypothetical protein